MVRNYICFTLGTIFFGQCLLPEACQMFSCENVLDFIPGSIPVKIDNCETSCCEENLCNFEQYQEITTSIKGNLHLSRLMNKHRQFILLMTRLFVS